MGTKPKTVAVCMIYFPAEDGQTSWCGSSLESMGYNSHPQVLQTAIQQMFTLATSSISIPGVDRVVPIPLFEVLDGKTPSHYHHRVEPSILGGQRMASIISQGILPHKTDEMMVADEDDCASSQDPDVSASSPKCKDGQKSEGSLLARKRWGYSVPCFRA